eukprot:scpid49251/ scgid11003/ 
MRASVKNYAKLKMVFKCQVSRMAPISQSLTTGWNCKSKEFVPFPPLTDDEQAEGCGCLPSYEIASKPEVMHKSVPGSQAVTPSLYYPNMCRAPACMVTPVSFKLHCPAAYDARRCSASPFVSGRRRESCAVDLAPCPDP